MNNKFILSLLFFLSLQLSFAQASQQTSQLKKVSSISSETEPAVFKLLFNSSKALSKKWDEELASEVSRVYAIVIDYNQNSYVVELISPATRKWKGKFEKVLFESLSKKQKKIYEETKKRNTKESIEGNG